MIFSGNLLTCFWHGISDKCDVYIFIDWAFRGLLLLIEAVFLIGNFPLVIFLDVPEVAWPLSESDIAPWSVTNVRLAALMLELVLDTVNLLRESFAAVFASELLDVQMGRVVVPLKAIPCFVALLTPIKWTVMSAILAQAAKSFLLIHGLLRLLCLGRKIHLGILS